MKTITATLAALLLAGASTAALAQDREHDRGQGQAQPHAQAPQGGQAHPGAPPGAPAMGHGGQAAPAGPPAPGRGFDHRDGQAHEGQGQHFQAQGQHFQAQGQHFQAQGQAPAPGPQRFDRGPGPGLSAQRQFDHERGPREVIPPTAERGQFNGRDGRAEVGRANGAAPWRGGEHWQQGRYPAVFWSQNRYRVGGYRAPYGYYVRSWGFGDFLPRGWFSQDYWLGDFLNYGLPYPPPGYEWVRVGGDALMVDRYTGRIVQVVRGIFW